MKVGGGNQVKKPLSDTFSAIIKFPEGKHSETAHTWMSPDSETPLGKSGLKCIFNTY
jgi:hypothetical protein